MSRIRGRDTAPEKTVRTVLHRMGLRFRLHRTDLPGKPDIVLPKYGLIALVHGCFWHRHPGCKFAYTPKSRQEFWLKKFQDTVGRDRRVEASLRELGWDVLVIWECQTANEGEVQRLIEKALFKVADNSTDRRRR